MMITEDQLALLGRIQAAFPEAYPVTLGYPGIAELRDAGLIDLYDMGPRGERRWTVTIEGREILSNKTQQ
jgi:hypothetical protein